MSWYIFFLNIEVFLCVVEGFEVYSLDMLFLLRLLKSTHIWQSYEHLKNCISHIPGQVLLDFLAAAFPKDYECMGCLPPLRRDFP